MNAQSGNGLQLLERVGGDRGLVGQHVVHTEIGQVVDRGARATAWAIIGVPASKRCGGAAKVEPSIDTVSIISPPPRNGGICASRSYLPQSTADAGRSVDLVTGEGQEVGAEVLHVDAQVRGRLRGVDDGQRADLVRPAPPAA